MGRRLEMAIDGLALVHNLLDVLWYAPFLIFSYSVWAPELGSEAQQRLLGVGSREDVIQTVCDAGLCVVGVVAWRVFTEFRQYLGRNSLGPACLPHRPAPKTCFPCCFV